MKCIGMKYVYSIIYALFPFLLQAQTLDGVFSCQGKEVAVGDIQLTAIAGQPFLPAAHILRSAW